jgi:PAS domain S-box-containing protein
MNPTISQPVGAPTALTVPSPWRQIEHRERWLWSFVVIITLLLTAGVASLAFPTLRAQGDSFYWWNIAQSVRGLVGLVLLFDIYSIYQQFQIQRIRRQLTERDELFRVISENAADLIALVDADGNRIYNSPAYERVLGYSQEELRTTTSYEQIHPDDRRQVMEAGEKACQSGHGQRLEYRIRHKDGTWRILESTASVVPSAKGTSTSLVIVNRDITDRKRAEERLQHNAFHDSLTDLPNRALFLDRRCRAFARANRNTNLPYCSSTLTISRSSTTAWGIPRETSF